MQLLVDLLESTFLLSVMSLRRSKDKCTLSFFARKAKKNAFCLGRQKNTSREEAKKENRVHGFPFLVDSALCKQANVSRNRP